MTGSGGAATIANPEDKPCEVCGDVGFGNVIASCSGCSIGREHVYCMRNISREVPKVWLCEDCLPHRNDDAENLNKASTSVSHQILHNSGAHSRGPSPSKLTGEAGWQAYRKQKSLENSKVKYISYEEAKNLQSGAKKKEFACKFGLESAPSPKVPVTVRAASTINPVHPNSSAMRMKQSPTFVDSRHTQPPKVQISSAIPKHAPQLSKGLKEVTAAIKPVPVASPAHSKICSSKAAQEVAVAITAVPVTSPAASKICSTKASQELPETIKNAPVASPAPSEVCSSKAMQEVPESIKNASVASPALLEICPEVLETIKNASVASPVPSKSYSKAIQDSSDAEVPETIKNMPLASPAPSEICSTKAIEGGGKSNLQTVSRDTIKMKDLASIFSKLEKDLVYFPARDAIWRGSFNVPAMFAPGDHNYALQAHPPAKVHRKAYEFSKKMPAKLKFNFLPRCELWSEIFQDNCPGRDDIALYFFPRNDRSRECYVSLLKSINKNDFVLRSCVVDSVELLLFSSEHLRKGSQRLDTEYFIWGVFCCLPENRNLFASGHNAYAYNNDYNVIDMEIDMIGGENVGRIDVAVRKLYKEATGSTSINNFPAPPGFEGHLPIYKTHASSLTIKEEPISL